MTAILIIIGSIALTALLFGIPKSKPEKPSKRKKKNFFVRLGETGDPVHFPK